MAQVNFRIDDETKREAEELFNRMGLTISSAITVFFRMSIENRGLPFAVQMPRFPSKTELERRMDDMEHGRNCHFHELIEVDNEEIKPKADHRRTANRRRRSVA